MYMRLINGRWFSNIRDKKNWKKKIVVSLDAYEQETRKATVNLGKILADIENGISPTSARKKIISLEIKGRMTKRMAQALRTHVYPYFGSYRPGEIDEEIIAKYIEHRFGLSIDGQLQAYANTIKKELQALQRLLQPVFGLAYRLPRVKYKNLTKEILPPLTLGQIERVSSFVMDEYKPVYWLMAYTGMDISDVAYLKPDDFKDGWIIKQRGKTAQDITIPICEPLSDILKNVPWPIKQDTRIFPDVDPEFISKHIINCFKKAGLDGYGSKYLRRFIASIMLDNGYSNDWIGKALGHAEGSKITKRYSKVYKATLEEAFGKIKNNGEKTGKMGSQKDD